MDKFNIKVEKTIDEKKWKDFLIQTKNLSLFSLPEYYKSLKAEIFFIIAYDEADSIIGGTICRVRGILFPFSIFSKSLWVGSGLLIKQTNPDNEKQLKKVLLHTIEREAKKQKCIFIRFNRWCTREEPEVFLDNGFKTAPRSTFLSDLSNSNEELYSKLDRNIKSSLKKAKKAKLDFCLAKENEPGVIEQFYNLYKLTQKRAVNSNKNASMTLKSYDFINEILKQDKLNCYLSYICFQNKLAAGLILVNNGSTILSYIAASDIEINRKYGASSLLFWESMLWAKRNNIRYFDFGGVPNNPSENDPAYGVYRFKKNMGGVLVQYPIGEKVLNPFKAKVFENVLNYRIIVRLFMKVSNKL